MVAMRTNHYNPTTGAECAYCGADSLLTECPAHSGAPCSSLYLGDDSNHEHELSDALVAGYIAGYCSADGGRVPCSRYGRTGADMAPWCLALYRVCRDANGDELSAELVDSFLSLLVNDSDEPAELLWTHGDEAARELVRDELVATHHGPWCDDDEADEACSSCRDERVATAEELGAEAGRAAGSWVVDGNTSSEQAAELVAMIDDCDPRFYDAMPAPLSGEWAGESLREIFGHHPAEAECEAYEDAYRDAYEAEARRAAEYLTAE